MSLVNIIYAGADIVAPILSVYYLIPQIHHTIQTKDVNGISCHSLYAAIIGNACWVIHALSVTDRLLLFTSIVILLLNFVRLHLYNKYKKPETNKN